MACGLDFLLLSSVWDNIKFMYVENWFYKNHVSQNRLGFGL
jgi:hypothetical protein